MNITLDFTSKNSVNNIISNQEIAILPSKIAKRLLKSYVTALRGASNSQIIESHITRLTQLKENRDLEGAIQASLEWIAEREIIQNVMNENWDAYKVIEQK